MKATFRILAWAAVTAAIIFWWPRPPGFNARWVSLPPAMEWQLIERAGKASAQPVGMTYTYCKWPDCQRS
jgi:hypothetical protein